MDTRQAMEFAAQDAADARYLLTYYPDHYSRILHEATGAVHWAINAWLLARSIEARGGWGPMTETYRKIAGKAAAGVVAGLFAKLSRLEDLWMPYEKRDTPFDPIGWRSEMNVALCAIAGFVAATAAEIGMPLGEDGMPM